jgi:hypothetical protein
MAFLAFLLRDQLQLRLLMGLSLFLQALYYYAIPGGPLFDPLFWKVVSFVANLVMIVLVFGGKLDFGIPEDLRTRCSRWRCSRPDSSANSRRAPCACMAVVPPSSPKA